MKKLYPFLFLSLFCGCSSSQVTEGPEKVPYHDALFDFADLDWLESIEAIPLETRDDVLLGGNPSLIESNGFYYVVDRTAEKIYRFDGRGAFVNSIGGKGNGPQEYLGIQSVRIDPSGDAVGIHSSLNQEEYVYGLGGDFLAVNPLPYRAQDLLKAGDDYWLYLGFANPSLPARLVRENTDTGGEEQYLPSEAKVLPIGEDYPVLVPHGRDIYIKETLNNTIYRITAGRLEAIYEIDFGPYAVPAEYFEKNDAMAAAEFLFQREFASNMLFLVNDDYVVLQTMIQKRERPVMAYGIKNIAQQKWAWCNYPIETENGHIFMGTLKYLTDDSRLLFLVEPYKLQDLSPSLAAKIQNIGALDGLDPDDNYVLLACRLSTDR